MALCPVCDTSSDAERCTQCSGAMLLGPGYTLERLLGAGGQSRVYAGRLKDGELVAIKILSLSRVKDPKALELFRRSAEVLVGLSHPGIAKLITYFEEARPHAALYCLVQTLIPGDTLAKDGRYDEAAAKDVAMRVLSTLTYLHGLSPPVIHRDIKPSNLMRKPDGNIVLIDFDLVRDVLRPEGGSTLSIGTPGFTPMEQYMGDATPATDLYALGVTLAVLLARKDPTEMRGGQRLELRKHVNASDGFVRVLEKLTEPEASRRFQSARDVIRAIEQPAAPPSRPRPLLTVKYGSFAALGLFFVLIMTLLFNSISERKSQPSPTIAEPVAPPTPVAVLPISPAKREAPAEPAPTLALSSERDSQKIWSVLAPRAWQGRAGDNALRIAFNGPHAKPKANVDGSVTTVEFSKVGVITVKRRQSRGDTSTEETFYLRLTSDQQMLTGTLETHFASGASSYDTNADITLRRIP